MTQPETRVRAAAEKSEPSERLAPLARRLLEHLRSELGIVSFDTMQPLTDLGLDSVEIIGLLGRLEDDLGLEVPRDLITESTSIETLCEDLDRLRRQQKAAPKRSNGATPGDHPFVEFVNPDLGRLLGRLGMGKTFVRARGCELFDADGRRYLDFMAGYGALPFGFNPPEIWEAVRSVEEELEPSFATPSFLGSASRLGERLVRAAGNGLAHVTFVNSGAEAIEATIKLARSATGRPGILTVTNGFHGKTLGALSATGNPSYQARFGAPVPSFSTVPFGDLDALDEALHARPDDYAAFIVEPIQGEGGVTPAPPGYLRAARNLCHHHGVLFAVDEIQTGLGRTGALFASAEEGAPPDIMTLAKALGGGLVPIGAVLYSGTLDSEHFNLKHSSTFAANALGCRAGLATLDRLERDDGALIRRVAELGSGLRRGLEDLARRYPGVVAEVRGRGFMLGIELEHRRAGFGSGILGLVAEQGELAPIVCGYLLNAEGVRVAPTLNGSNVVRVAPALVAEKRDCDEFLEKLESTLRLLARGDSAAIIGSIQSGTKRPPASRTRYKSRNDTAPHGRERRFAFLLNPSSCDDFLHFDRGLEDLSRAELAEAIDRFGELLEPFVAHTMRIDSSAGGSAYGEFIVVPHTPEKLLAMRRRDAVGEVGRAARLARKRGAQLIGLGGYTSVVTTGGLDLTLPGVSLTSGNSYTVVAGCNAIDLALARFEADASRLTAAVIGASGSIGSSIACMLAERFERLVLVGNPARAPRWSRHVLLNTAGAVLRHVLSEHRAGREFPGGSLAAQLARRPELPDAEAADEAFVHLAGRLESDGALMLSRDPDTSLPLADVAVTATSSPRAFISPWNLRPGALVCDLSQPPNVSRDVRDRRPDVFVIDGAVVECPGEPEVGPFGLEPGLAYPCMAETMMLALEGTSENVGIGPRLFPQQISKVRDVADKHGFSVVRVRSFGRLMEPADSERIARARQAWQDAGEPRLAGR